MGMYDRVDYTTDKGKPKGPGLFDVTPEEQAQRDKYAAMNEEAEYADYVARNRVGFENEPVKNPLGFAGGNAAQLAAPYNIDPGLMARQIDNTYATSRKPGRDSRKGRPFARNDAIFGDYGAQADTLCFSREIDYALTSVRLRRLANDFLCCIIGLRWGTCCSPYSSQ